MARDKTYPEDQKKVRDFVNKIIGKLIARWKHRNSMDLFCAAEIAELCYRARELIWAEPMCLSVKAPICVMGDLHGQYDDLLAMFDRNGWPLSEAELRGFHDKTTKNNSPDKRACSFAQKSAMQEAARSGAGADSNEAETSFKRYLFLGDYVDRGPYSIEVVMLLCSLKLAYPDRIFMLRGNHESRAVNCHYGFYREVTYRYDAQLYECFQNLFNVLPFCAVIESAIICMHGGISSHLISLDQFSAFKRPLEVADVGVLADLTWADPDPAIVDYKPSPRGASYVFGPLALRNFLRQLNLQMVIRAHQVVEDGYEFFDERRLVTIFSAPNYCGQNDNTAAILEIDKQLNIAINVYRPKRRDKRAGFERERKQKEQKEKLSSATKTV